MEFGVEGQDCGGQRLGSEHQGDPGAPARIVPHGLGDQAEDHHRYGGGSGGLYLPEPKYECLYDGCEFCKAHLDAFLCMEGGLENGYVLFTNQSRC